MDPNRTILVIPVYKDSARLAKYLPELLAELQKDEINATGTSTRISRTLGIDCG